MSQHPHRSHDFPATHPAPPGSGAGRRPLGAALALGILTAAYYLVPWQDMGPAAEWIGFSYLILYILFLPGEIISALAGFICCDPIERLARSLLTGLAVFLLAAFVWALTGISLQHFGQLLPGALAFIALLSWLLKPAPPDRQETPLGKRDRLLVTGFGAVLVVVFIFVFRSGIAIDFTKDTLDHVGYVAQIAESDRAFPTDAFYAGGGSNGEDIRKALLHHFYGYAAHYLSVAPMQILIDMNAFFAVLFLATIYLLALAWFDDRRIAVLSALIYLFAVNGGIGSSALRTLFYPNRFGLVFFFMFLVHGLRYLDDTRHRDLGFSAFFAFAACAVHVFFVILIAFAGAAIAIWKVCFPRQTGRQHTLRVLKLGLAAAAGVAPYCLFRFFTDYPLANEFHSEVQGVVFITSHLFVTEPAKIFHHFGALGILSFFALFSLWSERRNRSGLGYLIASCITVPLVLFNPLLLPLLHKFMSYLVFRVDAMYPFYILSAVFLVRAFARRRALWPSLLATAILFLVLMDAQEIFRANAYSQSSRELEARSSYKLWEPGLDFLRDGLEPHAVIASDPLTSYSISAFTSHYVVCTLDQHAPPNDLLLGARVRAGRDILSPYVSIRETLERIHEYGVTHIVLNKAAASRARLYYWSLDGRLFGRIVDKFVKHPESFELLNHDEGFFVLRVKAQVFDPGETPLRVFSMRYIPDNYSKVGKEAGEATLEAVRLPARDAKRGDPLQLDLVWSTDETKPLGNYVVVLRLDHLHPGLPFGGRFLPKISRKIKERFTGERYRYREDHTILGGFASPDTWRRGELVLDETFIQPPASLAPGDYALRAKLMMITNQPNYRLRDLVFDDDIYQGVAIDTLHLR